MGCDLPPRECLAWHYADHLAQAKLTNGGRSIQARCPVCDGDRRSLTISAGEHLRIVWCCHRKPRCDGNAIRRALIIAGVPEGCVPRGDGTEHTISDIVAAILTEPNDRAVTILRVWAAVRGYTRWPKGRELVQLAHEVHIGRSTAFDAKRASPLLPPLTPSGTGDGEELGKHPQVTPVFRAGGQIQPTGQVQPTGLPKVQPTGLPDSPPDRVGTRERRGGR